MLHNPPGVVGTREERRCLFLKISALASAVWATWQSEILRQWRWGIRRRWGFRGWRVSMSIGDSVYWAGQLKAKLSDNDELGFFNSFFLSWKENSRDSHGEAGFGSEILTQAQVAQDRMLKTQKRCQISYPSP